MPESLKTVLGFEAAGALRTINRLAKSIDNYNMSLFRATIITQKYNQVASKVDAQFVKQASAMKGTVAAQKDLTTQSKKGSQALGEIGSRAEKVERQTKKLADSTKKASKQMILSWQSVIRIFVIQVAHQAISKLKSEISEAAAEARKFEIGIAEIETIADTVGLSFDELADRAIKAAIAIGQPLDVVVEAQYQLLSNQVGDATASFMAFEASQRLSLAAVTPLNDAVALITGTLNAYGKSAAEADTIAAKLFKTVELGRVRIAEMGDTLGRVTVLGAQLGISLDEILASIATLTIQGVKAADAMTQVLNVQLKLIRPTDALKEAMSELGLTSAEAGIQAFGFQGFLEKLRNTTEGTATELGELFGRVRATRGALGITGKAADKYRRNLEGIKNATSDLLTEKLELIFETNAKQVEIELNKLNIQITENFGRGLNKILRETFDLFGGATETMTTLGTATGAAAATFLLMRVNFKTLIPQLLGYTLATDVATGATVKLNIAGKASILTIRGLKTAMLSFLATPMGAAIAVAGSVALIAHAFQKIEAEIKKTFETIEQLNEKKLKRTLKDISREHTARADAMVSMISDYQKYLTERIKLEMDAANKTEVIEKRMHESIVQQIKSRVSAIQEYANGITDIIDGLNSKLKKLRSDSRSIKDTIEAFKFERKTKGMDDIEKFYANVRRSQELRRKSQNAIRKGEIDLAKIFNEQALQYAKQALSAADTSKNHVIIAKAGRNVVDVYNDQINANNIIGRQERIRAARAEKAAPGLFAQVTRLQSMSEQYKDLGTEISSIETTEEQRIKSTKKQLSLASEYTAEIARFAKRLPEAKVLGLEEPFKQAIKAFREPLTGIKMDLSDAILFDATHLAKTLQISLDEAGDKVQLKIKAITGEETAIEQQKALLKVTEEYAKEGDRLLAIETAQNTINNLNISNLKATNDVSAALKEQETTWTSIVRWSDKLGEAAGIAAFEQITDRPIGFDKGIQQITDLGLEIENMIRRGEGIDKINAKLLELAEIESILETKGYVDAANKLEDMRTKLENGRDALISLRENSNIDMSPLVQELNSAGAAAVANTKKFEQLEAAIKRAQASQAAEAKGKSLGGMIYRQYGGFTPKGTDTIPAMLSPGEFVVNAKSSRQFFSQLVAMNSGVKPIFRAQGGPTTTVGDINITVQGSATPHQTARETMSAFRREMRRRSPSEN